MRKTIVTALILVATYAACSVAEVNTANQGDDLVFYAQARQGSDWLPLNNRIVNSAAGACVYGEPGCHGYPNAACQPRTARSEGADRLRDVQCIGSLASPATAADLEAITANFSRASTQAKGKATDHRSTYSAARREKTDTSGKQPFVRPHAAAPSRHQATCMA